MLYIDQQIRACTTLINSYLIYYFTQFEADIFNILPFSYVHFETIKNELIYNINIVYIAAHMGSKDCWIRA